MSLYFQKSEVFSFNTFTSLRNYLSIQLLNSSKELVVSAEGYSLHIKGMSMLMAPSRVCFLLLCLSKISGYCASSLSKIEDAKNPIWFPKVLF